MKFICKQSEINEALNNVSRAVPQKSPITSLTGIKISVNKNTLELTGYDLELGIRTKIGIQSEDFGEYVFEARLFCEIVRKMPSEEISVEIDSNLTATIKGDKAEYKILAMSADDYPAIPDYDTGDNFTISQPLLKNMINQTIFAVAVTDNKPILTGELFDITDFNFNLVAIDGHRLAVRSEKIDTDNRYNFVVKAKTLSEAAKLLKDNDEEKVTMAANIQDDLGADSLDIVDLVMSFEDEFDMEIPDDQVENIKTVGDVVKYIEENTEA